jgi:DNA-binding NarL/FixJ family response regulator
VLIADAQPTFRLGTSAALEDGGFVVVAQAATADEAVMGAVALRPATCVLACSIPGGGLDAARAITTHLPETAVLMLTEAVDEGELLAALQAGASGYLPKSTHPDHLCGAVHAVLAGDTAIPRLLVLSLLDEIRAQEPRREAMSLAGGSVRLTPRETQVVVLLRRGLSTRGIATELGISDVTVRRHLSNALRKLGVSDRSTALDVLAKMPQE